MKENNFKIIELKPEINKNTVKRSVFIKDFVIHEIIGIHDHEKTKKQKIKFNIIINVDQNTLPDEGDLKSIIDYEKIKPEELVKFAGCFLTGTAAEVTPVSQIDKYKFSVCNVTKDLSESYQALVRKKTVA